MSEQSTALRLADELAVHAHHAMNGEAYNAAIDAAAELRRLSAVNQELLEALQMALSAHGLCLLLAQDAWKSYGVEAKANAAIARAAAEIGRSM
jgi:hypothetical protein